MDQKTKVQIRGNFDNSRTTLDNALNSKIDKL